MAGKDSISRKKFIGLGAALGLGSVGASVIAGCGGGGSAGSGETTSDDGGGSTSGGGSEVGKGQATPEESEVTPEAAVPFTEVDTEVREADPRTGIGRGQGNHLPVCRTSEGRRRGGELKAQQIPRPRLRKSRGQTAATAVASLPRTRGAVGPEGRRREYCLAIFFSLIYNYY